MTIITLNDYTNEGKEKICRVSIERLQKSLQDKHAQETLIFSLMQAQCESVKASAEKWRKQAEDLKATTLPALTSWIKEKSVKEARLRDLKPSNRRLQKEAKEQADKKPIDDADKEIETLKKECANLKAQITLFNQLTNERNPFQSLVHPPELLASLKNIEQSLRITLVQIEHCKSLISTPDLLSFLDLTKDPNPVVSDDNGSCTAFAQTIFNAYLQKISQQSLSAQENGKAQKEPSALPTTPKQTVRFGLEQKVTNNQQAAAVATPDAQLPTPVVKL